MKKSFGLIMLCAAMLTGVQETSSDTSRTQAAKQLNTAEQILVSESRKAIIETGMSESYFDSHFKVRRVENKTSDRRVVWQLTINGYEAYITDSIGYYVEGANRIDVHSVRQSLVRTTEIVKTISRRRALTLMKACIGSFSDPSVQFAPVEGTAQLLLVAHKTETLSRGERAEKERREAREREREREKDKGSRQNTVGDVIENEGDEGEGKPVIIGYINLQTGKCAKGQGVMTP